MKNIYVYCEGQTEEAFVKSVLYDFMLNSGIIVIPIICTTKRTASKKFKGGISDYASVRKELSFLCKVHKNELVTTMIDLYGLPDNTPGINASAPDVYGKVNAIEQSIADDVNERNLLVNLTVHEFEALLFSDVEAFIPFVGEDAVDRLRDIRNKFISPEYINSSVATAPSKRILEIVPEFSKTRQGVLISRSIGIDKMIDQCSHFSEWIKKMQLYGSK